MAGISDPFDDGLAVAASPAADLDPGFCADGVYVVSDGNLCVRTRLGTVLGPFAVVAGQLFPFRVNLVKTTNSAAIILGRHAG